VGGEGGEEAGLRGEFPLVGGRDARELGDVREDLWEGVKVRVKAKLKVKG